MLRRTAASALRLNECNLYFTLQNAAEFWNVSTRPRDLNGHGLTPTETGLIWREVEQEMTLLPDSALVYQSWRDLLTRYEVRGLQVHDAKLAAAMLAHGVPSILTPNTADFARYPGVQAVHPLEVGV